MHLPQCKTVVTHMPILEHCLPCVFIRLETRFTKTTVAYPMPSCVRSCTRGHLYALLKQPLPALDTAIRREDVLPLKSMFVRHHWSSGHFSGRSHFDYSLHVSDLRTSGMRSSKPVWYTNSSTPEMYSITRFCWAASLTVS